MRWWRRSLKKAEPAAPGEPGKVKGRRRWLRHFVWTAAILCILIALFRFALILSLPLVLEKVSAGYGLRCTYERLDITFIGMDVELWHLDLSPQEGGEPFVHAEYCRADVATLELLRGRLVVRRIESDGMDLLVERDADGSLPLLKRLQEGAPAAPAPLGAAAGQGAPSKPFNPAALSFAAPVEIDALRVQHLHARIRDRSLTPPLETMVEMDLRLSDVGSPARPARFELVLSSTPILDSLRIDGQCTSSDRQIETGMNLSLRGFHPKALAGYLEPLGIRPVADSISFAMKASVSALRFPLPVGADPDPGARKTRKSPPEEALKASLVLEAIQATVDGEEMASLGRLEVDVPEVRAAAIHVAKVLIQGGGVSLGLASSGAPKVLGLEFVPAAKKPAPDGPPPVPGPQPTGGGTPGSLRIDEVRLADLCASFLDETFDPPAGIQAAQDDFSVRGILLDPADPGAALQIAARFSAPGLFGHADLMGAARPFADQKTLDLSMNAEEIRPVILEPWLGAAGIGTVFESGSFTLGLHASLVSDGDRLAADLLVDGIRLSDRRELLALDRFELVGADLDLSAGRIGLERLEVSGPRIAVRREASGALDLLGFRTVPKTPGVPQRAPAAAAAAPDAPPAAEAAPQVPPSPGTSPALKIAIGRILCKDVRAAFADEAVEPPASLVLEDGGIDLADLRVDLDPAAAPNAPSRFKVWLASPGLLGTVTAGGTIVASPKTPSLDLEIAGKGITLAAAAPYLRQVGIEPALKDGALRVKLGASAALASGEMAAALVLGACVFEDSGSELLGLDGLQVKAALRKDAVEIAAVEIDRPRAAFARSEDGSLLGAGLRIPLKKELPAAAPQEQHAPSHPLPSITLASLRLKDAALQWNDRAVQPAVGIVAGAAAEVEGLVIGREAEPAKLKFTAKVDGALDAFTVTGTASLAPVGPRPPSTLPPPGSVRGRWRRTCLRVLRWNSRMADSAPASKRGSGATMQGA